ncbi:hypothetical protein ABZ805_29230 [Saccharopolyspora sp. NPDC047091]|uniref:hypothetical protein n=1 Tax=Saccharopolyspora sp. NPDC047091 TaxID=3155924 RepID=UPI0033F1824C
MTALRALDERVHSATGRQMHYVACEAAAGFAAIGDEEEIGAVVWDRKDELAEYVTYGFFKPVQEYLNDTLAEPVTTA